MSMKLSEEAQDMLVNAELRIGGAVGVGSEKAEQELRTAVLIGREGGLTRLGVRVARECQREWYGE